MDTNLIIEYAKTKLGTPYSKLDCSHFVAAVFKQFGVILSPPAAGQAKFLFGKGLTFTDKTQLQVGDLLFWKNNFYITRWRRIHHVAIWLGSGQIIESCGKDVHICKLWESKSWPIILYGRPISLIPQPAPAPVPVPAPTPKPIPAWKINRVLKTGSMGEDVKNIQRTLNKTINAGLVIDGDFGIKTKEAVIAFQRLKGLKVDGQAGKQTVTALGGTWTGK